MAKRVDPLQIGIDVSKSELWIQTSADASVEKLDNQRASIVTWLRTLPAGSALALEAINIYHIILTEEAYRRGYTVYRLDGYRLNRYRESVGGRAKTDRNDAQLLRRYLVDEGDDLKPWSPPPKAYRQIQTLLRRRATLVESRKILQQSLKGLSGMQTQLRALMRQMTLMEQVFEKRLREAVQAACWQEDVSVLRALDSSPRRPWCCALTEASLRAVMPTLRSWGWMSGCGDQWGRKGVGSSPRRAIRSCGVCSTMRRWPLREVTRGNRYTNGTLSEDWRELKHWLSSRGSWRESPSRS